MVWIVTSRSMNPGNRATGCRASPLCSSRAMPPCAPAARGHRARWAEHDHVLLRSRGRRPARGPDGRAVSGVAAGAPFRGEFRAGLDDQPRQQDRQGQRRALDVRVLAAHAGPSAGSGVCRGCGGGPIRRPLPRALINSRQAEISDLRRQGSTIAYSELLDHRRSQQPRGALFTTWSQTHPEFANRAIGVEDDGIVRFIDLRAGNAQGQTPASRRLAPHTAAFDKIGPSPCSCW
jgi:hypothetical protein